MKLSEKRLLRNSLRGHITTHFRGRDITFKSKSTQTFDLTDEEDKARYDYWLKIYGGLIIDATPNEWKVGDLDI